MVSVYHVPVVILPSVSPPLSIVSSRVAIVLLSIVSSRVAIVSLSIVTSRVAIVASVVTSRSRRAIIAKVLGAGIGLCFSLEHRYQVPVVIPPSVSPPLSIVSSRVAIVLLSIVISRVAIVASIVISRRAIIAKVLGAG